MLLKQIDEFKKSKQVKKKEHISVKYVYRSSSSEKFSKIFIFLVVLSLLFSSILKEIKLIN
jgi:hypothetical protein